MADIIKRAQKFAESKHKGQFRLNGESYINHPIRVARIVKKYKKSHKIDELVAAALLHDTLEDTETSVEELTKNFGNLVTFLVIELTTDEKKKNLLGKTRYLSEKLSDESKVSRWALVIKLADRLDNIRDSKNVDIEFRNKYKKETKEILNHIKSKRNISDTHKNIIAEIERELSVVSI